MNAIIRKKCEAPVLTNEAIEVHLMYLRSGLDAVQSALPVLRDKIDQLSMTVDSKIEKSTARIEAVNAALSEKIDKTNARIEAINTSLGEKIVAGDTALGQRIDKLDDKVSKLSDDVAEVRGYQKALFWVISIVGTVAAAISIARDFDWI